MQSPPTLARITIFPVKSLDGVAREVATMVEGGCLAHDREFAIVDAEGDFINGKANPLVHTLRSKVDFTDAMESGTPDRLAQRLPRRAKYPALPDGSPRNDAVAGECVISFRREEDSIWHPFNFTSELAEIDAYLSTYFMRDARLVRDPTGRFMDIPVIAGLTVVSTASIEAVAGWFNLDVEETRQRFRATIEIEGVPAFWEDRLFGEPGEEVEYRIGDVTVFGMGPRARCAVPPRNPRTGDYMHGFQKTFSQHRAASLPAGSLLEEYEHYYYLTVNTSVPPTEVGKKLRVGDRIFLSEAKF